MTLYSVQVFKDPTSSSRPLGRRLLPRHRAKRVVAWLTKRGVDAYIAPAKVVA